MKITHQMIADKAGVGRTTVTKILNRYPGYSTTEEVKQRVLEAAKELGFNTTQLSRPITRQSPRVTVNAEVAIAIVLKDGETYDMGSASIKDMSVDGALLTDLKLANEALPLQRFFIKLLIKDVEGLEDLVGECDIVRFATSGADKDMQIGVTFVDIQDYDRKSIEEYIRKHHQ